MQYSVIIFVNMHSGVDTDKIWCIVLQSTRIQCSSLLYLSW